MTSIIQAMNSRGVAFATDSAVSWKDGFARPSAQKLFSLTGRQPIAYMVMGNGTFAPAGLSWDRIFHKYNLYYSEKYGPEHELDTVEEYEEDFINFLETLYSQVENDYSLSSDIWNYWAGSNGYMTTRGAFITTGGQGTDGAVHNSDDLDHIMPESKGPLYGTRQFVQDFMETSQFFSEKWDNDVESQFKAKQIEKEHSKSLLQAVNWIILTAMGKMETPWEEVYEAMEDSVKAETDEIQNLLLSILTRWLAFFGNNHGWKQNLSRSSVVFGGFGRLDEYPKSIQIATGSRVNGIGNSNDLLVCRNIVDPIVDYPVFDGESGEWRSSAFLESFAQNEYITRITTGQSDGLKFQVQQNLQTWIDGLINVNIRADVMEDWEEDSVEEIMKSINKKGHPEFFSEAFVKDIDRMRRNNKNDFTNAVKKLSPHELGELTLELVGIQAKIHNIVHPHSTVDLPVDVCYLSKEKGFIWYRRKNMPDPSINPRLETMSWPGSQID